MEKKPHLSQETTSKGGTTSTRNVPKKSSDHGGATASTSRSVPSSEGAATAKARRPAKKDLSQSLNLTTGQHSDPLQLQVQKRANKIIHICRKRIVIIAQKSSRLVLDTNKTHK